jgi:hypothetical protein
MILVAGKNPEESKAMKETPQEYIQRIKGNVKGRDPLKVQAETPHKIGALLKGASAAKLNERPAPGKWSVAEIVVHLGDCEIAYAWRIRSILGAPGMALAAFDQDAWASSGHYAQRDPQQALEQYRVLRENNLALCKTLTPEQWQQYGMHSERGKESIEHMVHLMAGHDINHLTQIEGILAAKA